MDERMITQVDILRGLVGRFPRYEIAADVPETRRTLNLYQLLQEIDAMKTPPTPPRRLREYKGVTYGKSEDGREIGWKYENRIFVGKDAVACLISHCPGFDDADHAPLLALRDDPWEPVETLEEVVGKAWSEGFNRGGFDVVGNICKAVRAHLATQPVSVPYTLPITPEQAVAVLVEKGARLEGPISAVVRFDGRTVPHVHSRSVLILPTDTPVGGK